MKALSKFISILLLVLCCDTAIYAFEGEKPYDDFLLSSWKCERCGRYNLEGISACAYCGKPRYD